MKRQRKIAIVLSSVFVLLVGLISLVGFNLAQASDEIPATVQTCLPPATQTVKVWGRVATDTESYTLIGTTWKDNNEDVYQEVLIYLNAEDTCRSLLPEDDPVLSHYIPLQLARELALQRYTRVLQEQGGREAYQQQLTDYLIGAPEDTRSEFPPEHIWALEQLGIELPPDSYEVLP
ncbi:MAG: hypothetical protein F6J95_020210 [Leptolyngbya sp. SIO1E4]|nr:hypothetical protein [Leptolyngbya sp. SIO1E4]